MQYKFKLKVLFCFTTTILKMNAWIFMEQERNTSSKWQIICQKDVLDKQRNHDRWYVNHINFQTIYGENSYLMCKLSDLVINIWLLHFFYLTLSKFLSLRHVSMPYFQFWRPCLLLPCKKRGDWFTGKPDVGLNYQIFLTLRDEYCL